MSFETYTKSLCASHDILWNDGSQLCFLKVKACIGFLFKKAHMSGPPIGGQIPASAPALAVIANIVSGIFLYTDRRKIKIHFIFINVIQ